MQVVPGEGERETAWQDFRSRGFLALIIMTLSFEISHKFRNVRFLIEGRPNESRMNLEMPPCRRREYSIPLSPISTSRVTKWISQQNHSMQFAAQVFLVGVK
jgi:hypothetical protein